uniref:Uncharacterized protein n=1 Tax=Panagrolaimus davidi TaxID=227884 RepID=A0A914PCN7_9BILA
MFQDGDNNRTKFIDVVSGSSNFDQQCKDYQKEYEELVTNLKSHQNSAQQTGTELHRLSVAHGKRKDIEDDLQKLADARTNYYLLQMYPVEKELETLESKYQKQKTKLEKDLTEPEDELHDAQVQKQEEVNTLLAETKQIKATKTLAETEYATAKIQMDACNQQISYLQNKVSTNEKMLKAFQVKSQEKQDDRKEIERKNGSQASLNENEMAQFYELSRFVDEDKISDELRTKEEKFEVLQKELESYKDSLLMEEEKLVAKRRELSLFETNDPQQAELDSLRAQVNEIERDIEKVSFVTIEARLMFIFLY